MDGAHIRPLPGFSFSGDFLLARLSEADQVLQSHLDPLHFIFSAAKELGIQTKAPSFDNGYACIIQATHSAAGYSSVSLIEEKSVL